MKETNLVFIMADEHNSSFMGCAGHHQALTPRLDELAMRGTRFANAYTPSPLCVPARAAMVTGQPVHQIGYWDGAIAYDGRVRGWPHRLTEQAHRAVSIGKLHYRDENVDTGFDETIEAMHLIDGVGDVFGLLREEMPPKIACKRIADELGRGDCNYLRYDRRITERACEWIGRDALEVSDKPFALFVSFAAPHYPLVAPPEFYDLYADLDIELPRTMDADDPMLHPWVRGIRKAWPYGDYMDDEKRRIGVIAYLGMCSFMDSNVGRVLDALNDAGLDDNTRIIYASDHGECLGNRGLWGKMTMYEDAASIPMIMAGPDVPSGHVCQTPVSLLDIYPTVLSSVGVEPIVQEEEFWGCSLAEIAASPDDLERAVLSEYHGAGAAGGAFMVRKGRYKYIHYVDHEPELFDVLDDPEEQNNLATSSAHAQILSDYKAQLCSMVDPVAADRSARQDQRAALERFGGREAVLNRGSHAATPAPGQ